MRSGRGECLDLAVCIGSNGSERLMKTDDHTKFVPWVLVRSSVIGPWIESPSVWDETTNLADTVVQG